MSDERVVKSAESLTITFREAVALTGLSRNTLYKLVKAGDVPGAQKLGNWYRFHRALLVEWLEGKVPRRGSATGAAMPGSDRRGEKGGRRGEERSLHHSPSPEPACP